MRTPIASPRSIPRHGTHGMLAAALSSGLIGLIAPAFALGCSSSSTAPPSTAAAPDAAQDPGLAAGGEQPTGHDANPYGIAYPTTNVGTNASTAQGAGRRAGNQIKNYKFLGYPGGDVSKGLQTIALADYFDPQGKLDPLGKPSGTGIKVIFLGAASLWCNPCKMETKAIVSLSQQLAAQGVVFLQALNEGATPGIGSTQDDLKLWIQIQSSNFTEFLDTENAQLGPFFNEAAVPWSAHIDARSMEILQQGVGYSGDIMGDLQPDLDWVNHNPPSYSH